MLNKVTATGGGTMAGQEFGAPGEGVAFALRRVRLLRAVDDGVDDAQVRVEQADFALHEREAEVEFVAAVAVARGEERAELAGRDEGKRFDAVATRPADQIVREIQSAERHGQRVRIVNLDELRL
jgi:hypothetical protein